MYKIQAVHTIQMTVSQEPTDLESVKGLLHEAEENGAKVIAGACSVEKGLTEVIAINFQPVDSEKRKELKEMILDSDWCSFGNKRKLIEKIILNNNLLLGEEFTHYQKLLGDTMKFRNAFAHGQFHVNQQTVTLSYFQDKPQTQVLTDDYLKLVEQTLYTANRVTQNLAVRMGVNNVLTYGFNQTAGDTLK
jgi:hypothetical protein